MLKKYTLNAVILFNIFLCFYACKTQHHISKEKIKVIYFNANDTLTILKYGDVPKWDTKRKRFYRNLKEKQGEFVFYLGDRVYVYDKNKHKREYVPKNTLKNYEIMKSPDRREYYGVDEIIDLSNPDSIFLYQVKVFPVAVP